MNVKFEASEVTPAVSVKLTIGAVWIARVFWWQFFMRLAKLSYPGKMRIEFENDTEFSK